MTIKDAHNNRPRTWVDINLSAIADNVQSIRSTLPPYIKFISVIKANAYGHGACEVAHALTQIGINYFAVATVYEALSLREKGINSNILVLADPIPGEEAYFANHNLTATVSCKTTIERLSKTAQAFKKTIDCHLKIDTGMGRLGAWHKEAPALHTSLIQNPHLPFKGIFTHFSVAKANTPYTHQQRAHFLNALAHMPGINPTAHLLHADHSASLKSFDSTSPFNAIRLGLLQYGIQSHTESPLPLPLKPTLYFHTRISLVKTLPKGTGIGYGLTHHLHRPSRIAVIAVGYGDGLRRNLVAQAHVLIRGYRCPIIGRVCMDQSMVDITDLPETPEAGEVVTLIGHQGAASIDLQTFSTWAHSFAHESLCLITSRVPRFYETAARIL